MVKYVDLKKGDQFNVFFYEVKPLNNNSELKQKYCLSNYQSEEKKVLTFIKDDNLNCHELTTNESFILNGNIMYNEYTGLYFYASYVDTSTNKKHADAIAIFEYFEDAAYYKSNSQQMVLSK